MAQMENEVAGRTAVGVAACAVAAAPASAVTAAVRATRNLVSHMVTFFNGHSFGERRMGGAGVKGSFTSIHTSCMLACGQQP